MKILNATHGKIGHCVIGPKYYLHTPIRLGEAAICVGRDSTRANKPYVWVIGGSEQLIDFVSMARTKGEIEETASVTILSRLDEIKEKKPKTAIERLASAIGVEPDELNEMLSVAQVSVSAPIEGVKDFSDAIPTWIPKTNQHIPLH